MLSKKKIVAVFVPLSEEFHVMQKVFDLEYAPRGTMERWLAKDVNSCQLYVFAPTEMGNLPAYEATVDFLQVHTASLVAAVGIGGALDGDLRLGDVAVGTNLADIVGASKIKDRGGRNRGYELKVTQRPALADKLFGQQLSRFYAVDPDAFRRWQDGCLEFARTCDSTITNFDMIGGKPNPCYQRILYPRLDENGKRRDYNNDELLPTTWCGLKPWPNVMAGHMASGVVVGSDTFDIADTNREFKVVETEGYGVGKACERFGVPFIVLRGISDFADAEKRDTPFRQVCAFNAFSYLKHYLQSKQFVSAIRSLMPPEADVNAKFQRLKETGSVEIGIHEEPVVYALISSLIRDADTQETLFVSALDLGTTIRIVDEIGADGRKAIKDIRIVRRDLDANSPFLRRYTENLAPIRDYFPGNVLEAIEGTNGVPRVPFHGIMFGDYLFFGMRYFDAIIANVMNKSGAVLSPSMIVDLSVVGDKYGALRNFFSELTYTKIPTE